METHFSKVQLKNKDNKSSEKILRKCVHCGFCNATCPTYQLLGDELDGPRGRIYLIKDMLENNKPANEKIVKHIDRCLSCYSCMTTCPSGVNYMHLIDHGRRHIEKTYKRSLSDRLVRNFLSIVLSKSINFRQALRFNEIFQSKHEILNSHINISPIFEKQDTEFFIKFLKKIKSLISLKKLCFPYVENFKIKQFIDQFYFIPHRVSNKYLNYLISKYFLFSKHYFSFEKLSVDYHGEQAPNYDSKIYLNNSKDVFDQYSLNVNWQLNEVDYRTIKKFSDYFKSMDNEIFEFKINKDIKIVNQKHRMGTTRMGDTKKDGVVDMNCKVFDVKNLYISGGSVFKTSSSSNPGITIMAMALRLAEYLNKS